LINDITIMSILRPGAHPGRFAAAKKTGKKQDCSHYCIPGVMDTWNEVLLNSLCLKLDNLRFGGGR
jgi:hypothetical protein